MLISNLLEAARSRRLSLSLLKGAQVVMLLWRLLPGGHAPMLFWTGMNRMGKTGSLIGA
jgi:hypothetical protein